MEQENSHQATKLNLSLEPRVGVNFVSQKYGVEFKKQTIARLKDKKTDGQGTE
uniref:Uncharacterized protein n=1 Tax=Rhizophora mucronata TaxID=61149 RepID=A0A2P2N281_RHIMU